MSHASSTYVLHLEQNLEAAEDHAFAVERHRLRIHHLREPRILHDLRVDAVAVGARLVCDPGEDHGLALLELDAARERRPLARLDVVGDAFAILERAALPPDLAGLLRHAAVVLGIL